MQRQFKWKSGDDARRVTTKSALTPQRRNLLELMQALRYGRIRNLAVRNGEPDLNGSVELIETVKISGRCGPHPLLAAGDYALKQEVIDMFAQLDELVDGLIEMIEVKDGLPFRMEIRRRCVDWPRTSDLRADRSPNCRFSSSAAVNSRSFAVGKQ